MRNALGVFAVLFWSAPVVLAQPRTAPVPPTPLPAIVAPPPIEIPPPPTINDPMLDPIAPAPRSISSWEEALDLVRARSTDLRIAHAEVQKAEAQSRIALAGTLPSLNGTGSLTHQFFTNTAATPFGVQTSPLPNLALGSVVLSQPIFVPRVWHNMGTAKRAVEGAQLSVEDLKRNIALNVANALVGVVTAERIAELNRSGFRNALERHELTLRKKNLGAATGLDVIRAQQDVESARAVLVTGDESLRQSREALGLAVGISSQVGVSRDINLDGLERSALAACHPSSLEERADLLLAKKQLEIFERNVVDVKLQFSPTISASSAISATTADTGIAPNPTWNIQGVLSVPFWEGGVRYGLLRSARADVTESEQRLESLRRNARTQAEQAHRGVQVASDSRRVAVDARALAAETDRLVRVGYIEGQGTSLELVIAAAALRQAEITLALREFDLVRARVLALLSLSNCPF
jgi:multidrug efflux system outer membrane protein